jgi:methyl-accepting chemotaxis protein
VLNRLSVNALLKSVIATLGVAVVIMLALSAWDSWRRLNAAMQTAAVAEASAHLFTALHNLRIDRASGFRDLNADRQLTSVTPLLRQAREREMPALKAALATLEGMDFPDRQATVTGLDQAIKKLAALHEEGTVAVTRPKAERRPGLAQEHFNHTNSLLEMLDKLSARLSQLVKLEDAFIDQLLQLKQLAWLARNAGGDASVMLSNALGGMALPPDALVKYTTHVSKLDTAWAMLEDVASGLKLPARFTQAVEGAKKGYFARDYADLRMKTLNSLIAGEKVNVNQQDWSEMSVAKLATLLGVAEASLDVAKDHAAQQRWFAMEMLAAKSAMLLAALLLAGGMMLVVSRRVTGPLQTIQQGMLALARGDLSAQASFAGRKDEIGALGGAMQVFKDNLMETNRLRDQQKDTEQHAAAQRKADMQRLANEFETAVGNIVDTVSSASTELENAAGTLTKTAETTQRLSGVVASASEDASQNVRSVASAAEEMAASVSEIARQVHESSAIAGEAVKQAEKTDERITRLSQAASRIGDVVKLITAIAEQTNLLALNATIEAARAGEAGRGFAVVAQEVKALAAQTAKATDEIGTQISSMQAATQESVGAIKEIGGTIGRISEIASAIAAAVEEQGAATQEISRNVQQAAHGTTEVATNITDVNRGASETGTASSQVLGSAQSLSRESGRLKIEVEKFVQMVRAA